MKISRISYNVYYVNFRKTYRMYNLKIMIWVILIIVILWGIQWMFHGFPTGN